MFPKPAIAMLDHQALADKGSIKQVNQIVWHIKLKAIWKPFSKNRTEK